MAYNGKISNGFNQLSSSLVALFVSGSRAVDYGVTSSQFYGSISASAFVGNGAGLTNISVDAIGDITTLKSGSTTAVISPNQGLRVNTALTVKDFLIVTGSGIISGSLNVVGGVTSSLQGLADSASVSALIDVTNSTVDGLRYLTHVSSGTPGRTLSVSNQKFVVNPASGSMGLNKASITSGYTLDVGGNALVTGDLRVTGTLSASFVSTTFITSSQLNVSTNLITMNTDSNTIRFGGIAVIDSGSAPYRSGSLLFDGECVYPPG